MHSQDTQPDRGILLCVMRSAQELQTAAYDIIFISNVEAPIFFLLTYVSSIPIRNQPLFDVFFFVQFFLVLARVPERFRCCYSSP